MITFLPLVEYMPSENNKVSPRSVGPVEFGNFLAAGLIRLLFKKNITDLCPLRAGKREKIIGLNLQEMTYGYPTEMMIKAILAGWRMVEIPVSYHKRIGGKSKIAGTVRGTILASIQILRLVFRYWLLEKKK